jgi:dolichyl-phosphate-mannose-protein mannosyltransferase
MTSSPATSRSAPGAWRVLLALTALALALRVAGLGSQHLIGDDLSVAVTARNFVELGWPEPTMWNHPRLRDLLVFLSLEHLGAGPWALKLWSVLLGTLSVPAVALLVLAVTSSLPAAAAAGLLVATDGLHLDFSRQAINDVYLSFLPVAAIVCLLRYRQGGHAGQGDQGGQPSSLSTGAARNPAWLALAGLALGLGVATKWSAAFPVGVAALAALWPLLRAERTWRERAQELALFASSLVLLPLAVYVLSYWPWFGRGHDLAELVRFSAAAAHETATHAGYPGTKLPGFPGEVVGAWRWFVQPSWYVDYLPAMPGRELPAGGFFLSGVANPLACFATLPAAAWAAWRWRRERDTAAGWLLLLFAGAYLPFVLVRRPIWTNSAPAVLPFAAALVGWAAATLHDRFRLPVRLWAISTLLLAALLWPPAMGISTRASDAVLRALVSRDALDPATHLTR